jgi:hypothetical protein
VVELHILQKQSGLYEFSLEISVGNKLHTINIEDRNATVQLPVNVKPSGINVDPGVNLLAGFEVMEMK